MLKLGSSAIIALLLALGPNTAVQAQPARVFVAAQGSDGNPCTFALPCRTFQHAHSVVAAGGEIDVLDPAGYGALNITKSISIQGHGFAGLAVPSGAGITINAGAADKVNLRGLLLDGIGTGGDGIAFNSGAILHVQESLIRNFSGNGINFAANATLSVSSILVADNALSGILVSPTGSVAVVAALDHVDLDNNLNGLRVFGSDSTGTITVTVGNSVVRKNQFQGIASLSNFGATTLVTVRDCTIASNGGVGLQANGSPVATLRMTRTTIAGNATGVQAANGGQLISFGDNSLAGNAADGAPSSTIPLQ
jgi:hypothetical protein